MLGLGTVGQRYVDRKPENHTVDIKADKILMTAPKLIVLQWRANACKEYTGTLKEHTGDAVGPQ